GARPRQGRAFLVGREGGDRTQQTVVEEEAPRRERDRAALAGDLVLREGERRERLRSVSVGDASRRVFFAERGDERGGGLAELGRKGSHRPRCLHEEDDGGAGPRDVERFDLEDLRARRTSRLVDLEEVGAEGRHWPAVRGDDRQICPSARPAASIDLHTVEEELRSGG